MFLNRKGGPRLFGGRADPDHKGLPAKYMMAVISYVRGVGMVAQEHAGTPGEWLGTISAFVMFIFHYV